MEKRLNVLTVLVMLLAASALAWAQPEDRAVNPAATSPDDAPAMVESATAQLKEGDLEGAIATLERLRRDPSAPPSALFMLGSLYLDAGRVEEALALLDPLAGAKGADPLVLYKAARANLALGRTAVAENYLVEAVREAPLSLATLDLAELRFEQGRQDETVALLEPMATGPIADRLAQDDQQFVARVAFLYARGLVATGKHSPAASALRRATELDPVNQAAWQILGDTLIELDRLEEAHAALAQAQALTESRHQAEIEEVQRLEATKETATELMRTAFNLRNSGRAEEALTALRQAIELVPDNPLSRMLEVRLLVSMRRELEALPKVEELVELTEQDPEALYLRGMVKLALRDLAGAEADLRRVLEAAPEHLATMNGLALLLMQRGENAEAKALLERLLEVWPNDEMAARNLERLRTRTREPQD
ncbi:MAG: tetratricopeptide repeat protein [bacterium]|nr:tetratricopeptide repeat protein [bacterium]